MNQKSAREIAKEVRNWWLISEGTGLNELEQKVIEVIQAERQRCERLMSVLENAEFDLRDFEPSSYSDGGVSMIKNLHCEIKEVLTNRLEASEKHDCEKWHTEGYGCSICSKTHILCQDISKVKEVQIYCNWVISDLTRKLEAANKRFEELVGNKP